MTNPKPITTFSDDAPKTNPWEEDRLGYRPFAARVAETLLGLEAPNGYVVGLHGSWGSGKSTALAFVQAFIKKYNDELPPDGQGLLMVDFRPWMVSGHQDLVSAFFKVLTEALPDRNAKLKKGWLRTLRFGKVGSGPVVNAAATLAVAALPAGAPAFKIGAEIAKSSTTAAIDRWLAEPSLQKAYDDLRAKLATTDVRIVVFIDDIDRLEQSEIKSTMQMVKTVGRLPNVVYVLAYDREIVRSALDDMSKAGGAPGFAEKIIQHELELPRPSSNALLSLFGSEIDFLPVPEDDSAGRQTLIVHGMRRWIRHPRDISRLSNAVKFAWPALEGEIDPMDLLCMEGLRLFDPQAFAWVRDNRDLLLGEGGMRMMMKEERAATMRAMREALPEATRDDQVELLCALFQNHAESIRGQQRHGTEAWIETVKRRGIAHEPGYVAYFSLFPPTGAIRKGTVDQAVNSLSDQELQTAILKKLLDDRTNAPLLVADYLMELQYRFLGRNAVKPSAELLHALFVVGEKVQGLPNERGGLLSLGPPEQMSFLITTLLEAWGQEDSGRNLIEAFDRSTSPAFCAEVYVRRARELGFMPAYGQGPTQLITSETFEALGVRLRPMIEAAVADGSIDNAPFYYDVVRAWSHLAGDAAPKDWIARKSTESASFLAKASSAFLAYSIGTKGKVYSLNDQPDAVYDIKALLAACHVHANAEGLNVDESARIQAVERGLSRFAPLDDDEPPTAAF